MMLCLDEWAYGPIGQIILECSLNYINSFQGYQGSTKI